MDNNLGQVALIRDINPGVYDGNYNGSSFPEGSYPGSLIEFNDQLYFSANDGESGNELFVTDGTAEGTQLLVDLNPGVYDGSYGPAFPEGSYAGNFIEFNNKLYFTANDGESGNELFVTDGTAEGTQLLVDLNPSVYEGNYGPPFPEGSNPSNFIEFDNKLYFTANNGESGNELFVSDGTAEGTQLLIDLNSNISDSNYRPAFPEGSYASSFIEFNGKLYFTANDGESGNEIFVSDGTAAGTQLLVDLNPSVYDGNYGPAFPEGSYASDFIEFNGKLYFTANDGESGRELFVSDGTAAGTQLLVDLRPDSSYGYNSGSNPYNLVEFNGKLYFSANDGESGNELFVTDGTAEGTQLVADINPNSSDRSGYGFYPFEPILIRDEFIAADGEAVAELFGQTPNDTVTPSQLLNPITGTVNDDNLVGTDADDEIAGGGGNDGVTGQAGNDVLNGKIGNDALDGGAGNDTIDGGEGTDTVVYQFAPTGVDVVLGEEETIGTASDGYDSIDSLSNLENVIGSDFDDNLTGNSSNNSLTGRAGADAILGLAGDDFITGGAGSDTISGGEGADQFIYFNASEGGDTISDFAVGVDKIVVLAAGFGGELSAGELPQNRFAIGSATIGNQTRFVFDNTSGELLFDADGAGAADAELIATLDGVSNLSAEDIMLL